ncbi:probable LRR receptor-like serine/threonine-protein kinase At1g07650 [Nymphaea colorata]|nr:probable LRR receptor-like serine/threonine-protein kinase At1g07650 [Nymphaea colorata]
MMDAEPVIFFFLLLFFLPSISSQSPPARLPPSEVAALQRFADILGKKDWDLNDPCRGDNGITCYCNGTICHVTSIVLKGQGLPGTLPRDLSGLPYLGELDLTRNYLYGSIPPEWGKLRLVNVSLMSNRLSGPIPKELGDMITLKNITLEDNEFSGPLPPEIGNLKNLVRLILSSNYFTGPLPATMKELTNMTDFRISDNGFSGKLPEFIFTWTSLTRLQIQGTSLTGPIPSNIGALENLTQLIMSDIKGTGSSFPDISQLMNLTILILRSCNISGEIPDYIGQIKNLKTLDLSFNNLYGGIPNSLNDHKKLQQLFLTSNYLSGSIPEWIMTQNLNRDLSFNNFTDITGNATISCSSTNLNLVESFSSVLENQSNITPCLRKNYPCAEKRFSTLFIDCGSPAATPIGAINYEADGQSKGAATLFVSPNNNWAMSSTGVYLDNDDDNDEYIEYSNSSLLSMPNSELYKSARIAATSLKYYGLCLYDGNYTVKLHFAEIMITDEKNFSSLGRRLFDVYIQGELKLQDFNIKESANGSFKDVTKVFPNITVTSGSLRIHLFWAGKGTTVIPKRGVYGPLISAITVTPEFEIPKRPVDRTVLVIVVVVASAAVLIIILLAVLYARRRANHVKHIGGPFTLRQIKAATRNFHQDNKIGQGGFGPVYKGCLPNGTVVAIKQLSAESYQGNREYITEIGLISALQHPNLVKLYGCCTEGNQLFLVYEYMENNSLAHVLFRDGPKLDWNTRRRICIGVAKGLAHLHGGTRLNIVHRDIKPTNILLDKDLNAKISDFGLAKLVEADRRSRTTRIVGTEGYIAPEYKRSGRLSCKADVYSFGIVVLEVVSGKSHRSWHSEKCLPMLDWALVLQKNGRLLELVDPELGADFSEEEAYVLLDVALRCIDKSPSQRPDMCTVVGMMENQTPMKPQPVSCKEKKTVPSEVEIEYSQSQYSWVRDESQDGPWTASMSGTSMDYTDSGVNPTLREDSHPVDIESGRRRRRYTKNQRTKSVEHRPSWSSCYSGGTKK